MFERVDNICRHILLVEKVDLKNIIAEEAPIHPEDDHAKKVAFHNKYIPLVKAA